MVVPGRGGGGYGRGIPVHDAPYISFSERNSFKGRGISLPPTTQEGSKHPLSKCFEGNALKASVTYVSSDVDKAWLTLKASCVAGTLSSPVAWQVEREGPQGYLAYKNTPPPRTLQ